MRGLTGKLGDVYIFIRERRLLLLLLTLIGLYALISFNHGDEAQPWRYERTHNDEASMSPTLYLGQGFLSMSPQIYHSRNLTGELVEVYLSSTYLNSLPMSRLARAGLGRGDLCYLHRCIWDNGTHIRTQGDNPVSNSKPDPLTIHKDTVQSIVVYIFPRFIEGNGYWNWRIAFLLYASPLIILLAWYPINLRKRCSSSTNSKLLKSAVILSLSILPADLFIDPYLKQIGLHLPFSPSLLTAIPYFAIMLMESYKADREY